MVPFERQLTPAGCGAAALVMAYRAFGLPDPQAAVWERVRSATPAGGLTARANRLAADALSRGLAAAVVRAARPWELLGRCLARSVVPVVNHRLTPLTARGHYSVVTRITDADVWLHDPDHGPDRRLTRSELEWCWEPTGLVPEIAGRVAVLVGRPASGPAACAACGRELPEAATCAGCGAAVPLRPAAAFGCAAAVCPGRVWERAFCPACDRPFEASPSGG